MVDLTMFLGTTAIVGNMLVYAHCDGSGPYPGATAQFTTVSESVAAFDGQGLENLKSLFPPFVPEQYLPTSGTIKLTLVDESNATLDVSYVTVGGVSQTLPTTPLTYTTDGNVLTVTDQLGFINVNGSVQPVPGSDSQTNTEVEVAAIDCIVLQP